jgi:hypothetical protein
VSNEFTSVFTLCSERQAATGAEGDRLKEGIVINQSLSTLGRCIKGTWRGEAASDSVTRWPTFMTTHKMSCVDVL